MPDRENNTYTVLPWFKALADETRLRLLGVLNRYELNVNELVLVLNMRQPRVSRHLKILSASGLLGCRRDGLHVFYSTPPAGKARMFINTLHPFLCSDPAMRTDLDAAAGMMEERARSTRQFFNTVAEDWDRRSREILGGFDLAATVCDAMPECGVAADLGCGTGGVMQAMLQKAETVIGVDGSPKMLELARRRFADESGRVSLRIGDLSHLPLRDGEAAFVSLNMVLHHISRPAEVLREIRRVLAPAGLLLLTDFDSHEDERMRSEYGDLRLGFERNALCAFLDNAGFLVRDTKRAALERGLVLHCILSENPAAA
jgi:ArsR family transcriptional regulator